MTGGTLGELFAALSFAGALIAMLSFYMAWRDEGTPSGNTWNWMGKLSFGLHGLGVFGVIGTLFYLIYTHQFQYDYVWRHSSVELPVHFMISCFWEGQEGSFLLWTFWHVVLGGLVLFWTKRWTHLVMAVISSVNLILASMILGIYISETWSIVLFGSAVLLPAGFLIYRYATARAALPTGGLLHLFGGVLGVLATTMIVTGKTGYFSALAEDLGGGLASVGYYGMLALALSFLGYLVYEIVIRLLTSDQQRLMVPDLFAAIAVAGFAIIALMVGGGEWKIGSSPFIMLRDVFVGSPIFETNSDFVPANGNGLNPLLQNYWMVIHPPVLFLGFASTVVPFAYVIAALIQGEFKNWIRPSAPWTIFSVMILGTGIIMGGYWAYETLNFGGYWNWDPVENSSFVPWLMGIASLHAMVAYRKSKNFLGMTMLLVVSTFLLVLYSTFLTRSGILGESSVHTFTDLGLSGQLLLLLFIYLFGLIALFVSRAAQFPSATRSIPLKSAEFFVFLGVITLVLIGLVITFFTSLPVINKVIGSNMAMPTKVQFFYYRWTIWLAIIMAILSGVGQFLYWRKRGKKKVSDALMRPYLIAVVLAAGIIFAIALGTNWEFGFDERYREWQELAELSENPLVMVFRYLRLAFFIFADEVLLFAALFMICANGDILVHLLRKNKKTRLVTGGSIAHIGFGLMLVGFLFSSGYDQVISKNIDPDRLAALPQDARIDNILLVRGVPHNILGYQVTYIGQKQAVPPIAELEVIEELPDRFKIRFEDKTGDVFAFSDMPKDVFLNARGKIDLKRVETFMNENMDRLKPRHINDRMLFGLVFIPREEDAQGNIVLRKEDAFILYPEAEVNPSMGLVAHPSRKMNLTEDIYVHVSTLPKDIDAVPEFENFQFALGKGDTVATRRSLLILDDITPEDTTGTGMEAVAKAHIRVVGENGLEHKAEPLFLVGSEGEIRVKEAYVGPQYLGMVFASIDPNTRKIDLRVQEQTNPPDDIIVIQALKKPYINVLWLGTFVLTFGFIVAIVRRVKENKRMQAPVAPVDDIEKMRKESKSVLKVLGDEEPETGWETYTDDNGFTFAYDPEAFPGGVESLQEFLKMLEESDILQELIRAKEQQKSTPRDQSSDND